MPIYRIDMCARILGSTSMSMSIHTFALGTYGRIRANAIANTNLKKWNLFSDKKSCLRTYGLSQCLKKRSPRVGELF